jgi:hypothetical protein
MQHAVTKLYLADQVVRPLTLIELWGVEIRADVLSVRDLHPVSLGRSPVHHVLSATRAASYMSASLMSEGPGPSVMCTRASWDRPYYQCTSADMSGTEGPLAPKASADRVRGVD